MKIFLRMKHWQLFMLLYGIPFILQIIMMIIMIPKFIGAAMNNEFPGDIFSTYIDWVLIIVIIYMTIFYAWFWTLGRNLYTKLPPSATMKLKRFKAFLIYPLIYSIFFIGFMVFMMSRVGILINVTLTNTDSFQVPNPLLIFSLLILILPLHLFAAFCVLYLLYFVSKAFKSIQLQRPVEFGDYVGEFFLFWFFFIGVWILQPKINKIFADTPEQ